MTRDEMIERQMKATGFTRVACAGFIDQLAGAAIIKLDEPKRHQNPMDKFAEAFGEIDEADRKYLVNVSMAIARAGLKIVERG